MNRRLLILAVVLLQIGCDGRVSDRRAVEHLVRSLQQNVYGQTVSPQLNRYKGDERSVRVSAAYHRAEANTILQFLQSHHQIDKTVRAHVTRMEVAADRLAELHEGLVQEQRWSLTPDELQERDHLNHEFATSFDAATAILK